LNEFGSNQNQNKNNQLGRPSLKPPQGATPSVRNH
jgi:hypothetical protein